MRYLQNLWILLVICSLLNHCTPIDPEEIGRDENDETENLELLVGISAVEDAVFFNEVLDEDDIVFTYGPKVNLLKEINTSLIAFGRQSAADLENDVQRLYDLSIDYINYNPEQCITSNTPPEEIDNIFESINRARELADEYNEKLSFGTDTYLLEKYGTEIAPLVDLFGIQVMRLQLRPVEKYHEGVTAKVEIVRNGSESVPLYAMLSLEPPLLEIKITTRGDTVYVPVIDNNGEKTTTPVTAEEVLEKIEAIEDMVDGIALLYTDETKDEMKKLLRLLKD